MVARQSPDWLPRGFIEKVKLKNGRKIKYYYNVATDTKYYSKKDVMSLATDDKQLLVAHKATNGDDTGSSSNKKVEPVLVKGSVPPRRLPEGWKMQKRYRKSGPHVGSVYRVYTHLSSGSKLYSMAAVRRYLSAVDHANAITIQNKIDNVDKSFPDISPQNISMNVTGNVSGKKTRSMALKTIDDVDKSCPEISLKGKSEASAGDAPEKKIKTSVSETVSIETKTDNDLPPGWIKEIRTRKSGKGTRKDTYYTDPGSGYVFCSKLDALRYVETNDIGRCVSKPSKRESDDLKLINNAIHMQSSDLGDNKLPEPNGQLILEGDSNGGEPSGTKKLLNSKRKRGIKSNSLKVTSVGAKEKASGENSTNLAETTHQLSESVIKKQANRTKVSSKKSKTRKSLSLPSRSSKRLATSKPDLPSSLDFHEPSLKASDTRAKADTFSIPPLKAPSPVSIRPTPDIESEDVSEHERIAEKIVEEIKPLEDEKPIASEPATGTPLEDEKPIASEPATRTDGMVNEKHPDDSKKPQESQLNYDFGDSWSDPLEFALKTLRGEIQLQDTMAFSGDLNNPLTSPFNEGEAKYDEPVLFHNEVVPCSESSKLQLNSSQSSETLSLLQTKSSLPSPSLNQQATISLSLANSSVSPPSFKQYETIANPFKPYGAFDQFPAANSSAPLKQYGAVSLPQANFPSSFPSFMQATPSLFSSPSSFPSFMQASPSLFSSSPFRQPGTVSQWPPTNPSSGSSSLFSSSFRQPGTIGQWPPTSASLDNSLFRQPGTVSQWAPSNPGSMSFSNFSRFNVQSSVEGEKNKNQAKFNP